MFNDLQLIGATTEVQFTGLNDNLIPARVDTGAATSAVWASKIRLKDKELSFYLFDKTSPYFNGQRITATEYTIRLVRSTNGAVEERYAVKLPIQLNGRKIRASFTLANRKTQVYPVLVGRNVLRGKFAVDVKHIVNPEG